MYKGTIWTIALLVAASFTTEVFAQTNTQNIPYTDTPPVLDGLIDDIYPTEGDGVFPMLNGRGNYEAAYPDTFDLWATAYAMWDEDYLYVIAYVKDDVLYADHEEGEGAWQDDSIELYIDGGYERATAYDDNDSQYRFRPGDPDTGIPPLLTNAVAEGIEWTNTFPAEGDYIIELRLPWSKNSVIAQTNKIIGFDIHVNDDDVGGVNREGKLHWSDAPGDNQWSNPSLFGTATLVGGTATQAVATIRREPNVARVGTEIAFDGSFSTAPGTITTYAWDLGDGTTADGVEVNHTYTEEGSYTVSLTVTDDGGVSGTSESLVKVYSAVGTPELPLEIPRATSAPVIDGVMDDVYSIAQVVQIANRANGTAPRDASDLSVTTYLLWDDDNLYALYDVTDDTLSNDSGDSWQDDTPEIYIDGGNQKNGTDIGYDDDDLQYEFGWGASTPTGNSPNAGNAEGVTYAYVDKDDGTGYILEAVVPWARSGVTPVEGLDIGFELMINDDDSGDDVIGERQTKASWFAPDGQDVAYNTPAAFGTARLVATIGSAAENPNELPGGFAIESMYPNPFNPTTAAILTVEQPGAYEVTVYNVLGQVVLRQSLSVQHVGQTIVPFDLRNQASGMYLFSFENEATGKIAQSRAMLLK